PTSKCCAADATLEAHVSLWDLWPLDGSRSEQRDQHPRAVRFSGCGLTRAIPCGVRTSSPQSNTFEQVLKGRRGSTRRTRVAVQVHLVWATWDRQPLLQGDPNSGAAHREFRQSTLALKHHHHVCV